MSEVITDKLTGKTSAGDVTVTDGSVTMKLQDGFAKAYVLFNGTGTVATRTTFNCSSVTDNDSGDYRPNWTSVFDSVNYINTGSCIGSPETSSGSLGELYGSGDTGFAAGSVDLSTRNASGTRFDVSYVHLISFGDLA